jgi:hypothetical protein
MSGIQFTSGVLNWMATNNDRMPGGGLSKVYQVETNGTLLVGIMDDTGAFLSQASPPTYSGQASRPPVACLRGTVPTILTTPFVTWNCSACLHSQYAPLNALTCLDCSSGQLCLTGGSVTWPPSVAWAQSMRYTVPLAQGNLLGANILTTFYVSYVAACAAGMIVITIVVALVTLFFPDKANTYITLIDLHTTDHPVDDGQPILCRRTVWGGYCTALYFYVMYLLIVFFIENYLLDKYIISQQNILGTQTLQQPTPFTLNMTFVSIDNFPACLQICSSTQMNLINGSLVCKMVTAEATCYVYFTVDPAFQFLPFQFSLNFTLPGSHAAGVFYTMSGATYLGKQYGLTDSVMAPTGYGFFDTKPLVIVTDLQPYSFSGFPDVDQALAPLRADGYLSIPNSVTKPGVVNAGNWTTVPAFAKGFGFGVVFSFNRQNTVFAYYLNPQQTVFGMISQSTALAVTVIFFISKSAMIIIEHFIKWRKEVEEYESKSPEQRAQEAKEAEEKRAKEFASNQDASTLSPDEVARQTMVLDLSVARSQTRELRNKAFMEMDHLKSHVAELKRKAAGENATEESEPTSAATSKPVKRSATEAGGKNSGNAQLDAAADRFPWQSVVAELVTNVPGKELVQALAFTSERDKAAMKTLAETVQFFVALFFCSAPFLFRFFSIS